MTTTDDILATIEARTRQAITGQLERLSSRLTAALATAIAAHPNLGAAELLSHPDVHRAITTALAAARIQIEPAVRAGYRAAARTARAGAPDGDYLAAVLRDVDAVFARARTDLANSVTAAYDPTAAPTARMLTVSEALHRAARRLGVHLTSAGVVAVHRGHTDAQLATTAPTHGPLYKTWRVTSANPCPACAALHGMTIGADEQFPHDATVDPDTPPPRVYRDLHGPPRHPNCRCRIDIDTHPASRELDRVIARTALAGHTFLRAADVRQMSSAQYRAFTAFLTRATDRIQRLLREIDHG